MCEAGDVSHKEPTSRRVSYDAHPQLVSRYLKCTEDVYGLVETGLLNIPDAADKERITTAIAVARALAEEVRELVDELSTGNQRDKAKLTNARGSSTQLGKNGDGDEQEHEGDPASVSEVVSKRRRKEQATSETAVSTPESREQLALKVMAVMKDAYGALPEQFWGLSKTAESLAPRGLQVNASSLDIYRRHFSQQNGYPIVTVLIAEPITIVPGVKTVVLGEEFAGPVLLCEGTEELQFAPESRYNQEITLPPGLKKVFFGQHFDRPVTLPSGLLELSFSTHGDFDPPISDGEEASNYFNQEIILPATLRTVTFGDCFDQMVTLPPLLEECDFGNNFRQPVDLSTCRKLRVLKFDWLFNQPLENLPPSLRELYLSYEYENPIDLNDGLEIVSFGKWFNHPLRLPSTLKHLEFHEESRFNYPIHLPVGLKTAIFGSRFSHELLLPEGLESITVNENLPLKVPPGCKRLTALDDVSDVEE